MLQYVAASFHLPSVSTANINTVQYPKQYKQCEIPSITAVVISKLLLPQSNVMAAFVLSRSNQLSDFSPALPTYRNHNVRHFMVVYNIAIAKLFRLLPKVPNCQHTRVNLNVSMPHRKVLLFFISVQITNDEFWQKEM